MAGGEWLLFLPQLPSLPSSLRVLAWRRLRAAGAAGLQNGVWVLPRRPEQESFLAELVRELEPQGGRGLVFVAAPLNSELQEEIVERFRKDRDHDYAEFCEKSKDFLGEVEKETGRKKFSFAELDEIELDLQKLEGWLAKIKARDFFGGHRAEEASLDLSRCREALTGFSQAVYEHEGLASVERADLHDAHDEPEGKEP